LKKNLTSAWRLLDIIAAKHRKLSCLAEQQVTITFPWLIGGTKVLLPIISKYKTSYIFAWRNAGEKSSIFAPYPGQLSADDFRKFANDGHLIFPKQV